MNETEAELYTAKIKARSALQDALNNYFTATSAHGMSDDDQADEIEDMLSDAGKTWNLL